MSSELIQQPIYKRPIFWGWAGTIVVGGIGLVSALTRACSSPDMILTDCPTKWTYLVSATPNELGDTLAGFAGALAFIWIIVTVAMQSLELAAQREELKLTRLEFERMAKAQDEQVKLLVAQGEIFADEQRERSERRFHGELMRRLELSRNNLLRIVELEHSAAWLCNLTPLNLDNEGRSRSHPVIDKELVNAFSDSADIDVSFRKLVFLSARSLHKYKSFVGPRLPIKSRPMSFDKCFIELDVILAMKPKLSTEDKITLRILGIEEIKKNWLATIQLWKFPE